MKSLGITIAILAVVGLWFGSGFLAAKLTESPLPTEYPTSTPYSTSTPIFATGAPNFEATASLETNEDRAKEFIAADVANRLFDGDRFVAEIQFENMFYVRFMNIKTGARTVFVYRWDGSQWKYFGKELEQ